MCLKIKVALSTFTWTCCSRVGPCSSWRRWCSASAPWRSSAASCSPSASSAPPSPPCSSPQPGGAAPSRSKTRWNWIWIQSEHRCQLVSKYILVQCPFLNWTMIFLIPHLCGLYETWCKIFPGVKDYQEQWCSHLVAAIQKMLQLLLSLGIRGEGGTFSDRR